MHVHAIITLPNSRVYSMSDIDHCILKNHMFGGFCNWDRKTIEQDAERNLRILTEKYGQPECGRNRATFISKHCVIKFPLNDNGIADNDWEGSVSGPELAKGRWIEIDGFVCVIQEKLTMLEDFSYKNLPDWVGSVDGGQVGYDKKGRLKAFDFGYR